MGGRPGTSFALARYLGDGALAPSFAADGAVRTRFGRNTAAAAYALAIQPDGKVIAVGLAGGRFALARYKLDGTPDDTFGSEGVIRTRFLDRQMHASASDIEILDDGTFLVSGTACDRDGCSLVLARYLPDGSLDPSFAPGGAVLTAVPGYSLVDMVVQADGRIVVVAGHLLFRFDPDGLLDGSFSDEGWVRSPVAAAGVGVQSDGGSW